MNDPRIICIETSSREGSVALAAGPKLLSERSFPTQTDHARELLPTLDGLCREAGWRPGEIEQCYLSIGPGSFTGLRVAVTMARSLALAARIQIVAVPTLDVIAGNCALLPAPPRRLAVILDAKRKQVFAAVFEWDGTVYRPLMPAELIEPAALLCGAWRPEAVTGEGISYHMEAVAASGVAQVDPALWMPRASSVHRLGWAMAQAGAWTSPHGLVPHYIRRPEAEELWEKRQAGA